MLPQHLKAELEREFSLVCFEDLASVRSQHGAIFRLFRSLRVEHFEPSQRLVFYTTHAVDQPFIDHIQRAAARIDISNFFILMVAPYDLAPMLHAANQRFGYDSVTIASRVMPIDHSEIWPDPGFADLSYLCPLPFMQAMALPDGNVGPCCKFKNIMGNIQKQDIQTIFHDQEFRDLRQQMISGQAPMACEVCWHVENQGCTSLRQLAIDKYGDMLDQQWLDQPEIVDFSWSPATLCNFKCRICLPGTSTSIAVEEIKWSNDSAHRDFMRYQIKVTNNNDLQDSVIKQILGMKQLRFLHILGGEPLLWPKFNQLLELLVDQGLASQIALELNTNVSVFPYDLLSFIQHNFAGLEILMSIDNVDARFELERGGEWTKILHNAKAFAALKNEITKIKLATTVNLQNVLYLNDVVALAQNLDVDVLWWYLEQPDFLSIDQATSAMQSEIITRYLNHDIEELHRIAERVANATPVSGQTFLDYVHRMDHRRNQKFKDTHPEAYRAMSGRIH